MLNGVRLENFLEAKMTLAIISRKSNIDSDRMNSLGFTERHYYTLLEDQLDLEPHVAYTYLQSILAYVVNNIGKTIDSVMIATLLETKHSRIRNMIEQILTDDFNLNNGYTLESDFIKSESQLKKVRVDHYLLTPFGFRLLMAYLVGLRGGRYNVQRLLWRVEVFKTLDKRWREYLEQEFHLKKIEEIDAFTTQYKHNNPIPPNVVTPMDEPSWSIGSLYKSLKRTFWEGS